MKLGDLSLFESINDKGIFKAIFMGGTAGAGKSYTITQIKDGMIDPRIVNTDKMLEFQVDKHGLLTDDPEEYLYDPALLSAAKVLSRDQLFLYLNSMLPLFIDTTSNDISNLISREGILESCGYDVGMIWVDTDFETALSRIRSRKRKVPRDVVERMYSRAKANKEYYKGRFKFFYEIDNNDGRLTNKLIKDAYNECRKFFEEPVHNPIGVKAIEKLHETGNKYLTPTIFNKDVIEKRISVWYKHD